MGGDGNNLENGSQELIQIDDVWLSIESRRLLIRNFLISDVVNISEVSVRLKNCIKRVSNNGDLPATTIGEYLSNYPNTRHLFCKAVPNFGKKSARELTELISRWDAAASSENSLKGFLKQVALSRTAIDGLRQMIGSSHSSALNDLDDYEDERALICNAFENVPFPDCLNLRCSRKTGQ